MLSTISTLLFLILGSSFASSSETAFFSLNRYQLRRIKDRYEGAFQRIQTLMSRPSRLLVLILLINELVNLSISSIVSGSAEHLYTKFIGPTDTNSAESWLVTTFLSIGISTPVLLIAGEITPKVIASRMNSAIAIINSKILYWLYWALLPALWIIDGAIGFVLRKFRAENKDHWAKTMSPISESDVIAMVEQSTTEGSIEQKEKELIKKVFEFDDGLVSKVMTPVQQVFSISAQAKISQVIGDLKTQKYSRIPVYQTHKRNIVGILYIKDILKNIEIEDTMEKSVSELMNRPISVPENLHLSVLFKKLKENKTHIAIVYAAEDTNAVVGVVTMDDVLASIFGALLDERDDLPAGTPQ